MDIDHIGTTFSRKDLSAMFGGSEQSYLPFAEGKVVCGCFDPVDTNPDAPNEILFGTAGPSRDINKAADMVFEQGQKGEAIPVFLKRRKNEWEYVGDYLCIGRTRDARIVRRRMKKYPSRGKFHGVLHFEKVGPD